MTGNYMHSLLARLRAIPVLVTFAIFFVGLPVKADHYPNSRDNRETLIKKYDITVWPSFARVIANPFVLKGQVIAIYAIFLRMTGEKEALFAAPACLSGDCRLTLFINNAPSTEFSVPQEEDILVLKVIGLRMVGGGLTIPDLEFVSNRPCFAPRCEDYGHFAQDGSKL